LSRSRRRFNQTANFLSIAVFLEDIENFWFSMLRFALRGVVVVVARQGSRSVMMEKPAALITVAQCAKVAQQIIRSNISAAHLNSR